jgi:hypothetical protein
MLRKMLIIISALMLMSLPLPAYGSQSGLTFNDSAALSASAKLFLSAWLVKRDVREAMQFVATKPVLAQKCDLPPNMRKVPRSANQRRNIVEQGLSAVLKVFPKYESLTSAIEPTEIPASDWFEVEDTDAFQIMRIKPGNDGYIMCKFEESGEYRKAMLRPDAYYVSFKLKNMNECSYYEEWSSLWAKEGQQWRLLSIGLLED